MKLTERYLKFLIIEASNSRRCAVLVEKAIDLINQAMNLDPDMKLFPAGDDIVERLETIKENALRIR